MNFRLIRLAGLIALPIAIFVLYVLALTGCVSNSPGLPSIFLVALEVNNSTELRVGYFGMCLVDNSTETCSSAPYSISSEELSTVLFPDLTPESQDSTLTTSTITKALQIQRHIFFSLKVFPGALFFLSTVVYALQAYAKSGNSMGRLRRLADGHWAEEILAVSVVLALVSAASVMQTANALEFSSRDLGAGSLGIRAGVTLQVLGWLAFACSTILCALVMYQPPSNDRFRVSGKDKVEDGFSFSERPGPPPFEAAVAEPY
ncbi:hypothetical protein B0I35DRAFT_192952 [Stachybotrys elegans]|uniref:Uncharacterized protein n=1 Tax=Stachybotrys elegans TaxID=80388 RepID=A0A8K0WT52_9HYPO|nr:hypothetical protein B0I35DRAFT_192952 [Stachybotrys elegans]